MITMETTMFRSTLSSNVQIPSPSLHFRAVASSASLHSLTFHRPLRAASLLAAPTPSRKPVAVNCSFDDDDGWSPTDYDSGSSLELKKKGMDMSSGLKGTSIYLVGMKSSMKSSIGKKLADALGYYYFDSDGVVAEASGGEAAAEMFKVTDEKAFRESETAVLKELSSIGRLVVCAGDGAVMSPTNLTLLRDGISVWIDIPLNMLTGTVVGQEDEVLAQLTAKYQELKGGFATADTKISLQRVAGIYGYMDLNEVTADDMGLEVLKGIEKLTRVKILMEEAARPF